MCCIKAPACHNQQAYLSESAASRRLHNNIAEVYTCKHAYSHATLNHTCLYIEKCMHDNDGGTERSETKPNQAKDVTAGGDATEKQQLLKMSVLNMKVCKYHAHSTIRHGQCVV